MRLYHFTHTSRLRSILAGGLAIGDLPSTQYVSTNAVSLTAAATLARTGSVAECDPLNMVRITVEIDERDRRLQSWASYAIGLSAKSRAGLEAGRPVSDWYIYRGVIRPDRFVDISGGRDCDGEMSDLSITPLDDDARAFRVIGDKLAGLMTFSAKPRQVPHQFVGGGVTVTATATADLINAVRRLDSDPPKAGIFAAGLGGRLIELEIAA